MPRKATTRRAAGEGTIRQRSDGRWEGKVTLGTDPGTGKQLRKSVYGSTQKEVRLKLQQIKHDISEGTYTEPSRMPLGEWLDIWLREYTGGIKEHTAVTYETQVRMHIKPALGAVRLTDLRPHEIQTFYNDLHKEGEGKPALSPKTIKNVHGVLHRALDQAVIIGYVKHNPCVGVRLPRVEEAEMHPLDDDQIAAFLKAIAGNEYETLFLVDLFTGMRQSEIMGLTWDCVDFESGTIYIDKQLIHEKKKGGIYKFGTPKNDKARRITPAPFVMRALAERKLKQQADKLKMGEYWQNDMNLVFTLPSGEHYAHNTLSHNFKRMAKVIGVPEACFHDLRHTYAVSSLRAGDDVKTVQENMGHHTAAFTLDKYGHVTTHMRNESAARMQAFIEGIKKA